jgi:hypothetical protein
MVGEISPMRGGGHRFGVYRNRVLRGRSGWKRDEVTGEWGELRNGELHNLYSSRSIIRMMKAMRMNI